MKIALGSDHAGLALKEHLAGVLEELGYDVVDMGTHTQDSCDYPDIAVAVATAVARKEAARGVLVCGTGIGMCITANKVSGIRAAVCHETFSAKASRQHNDANVLCMGQRVIGPGLAGEVLRAWLSADFEGGRHQVRVDKIAAVESGGHPASTA